MSTYDSTLPYPRDLKGYGADVPHANWPHGARVAVQFVLNYEEGGENATLHGDAGSEQFLSEMFNPPSFPDRHLSMEGIYEYGSRAGVWRILREFEQRGLHLTVFGIASAMQRHPELTQALKALGHDLCCHGLKWIHYQHIDEATEREHMRVGMQLIEELTGQRALGWYTGRDSPNTRRLVADFGGFEYDSDYYGDDLPFWMKVQATDGRVVPHLVVPYTLDANDMRFTQVQGFNSGEQFFTYLRDTFDVLYAEGEHTPRMMSVGMHCRLLGRPGRMRALQRFLDHVQSHDRVWVALSKQTGCVMVDTLDQFVDTLLLFQSVKPNVAHPTKRVALFGNGGGTSVLATDYFSRLGLDVTPFADTTIAELAALKLPPGTSITNPVDCPVGTLQQDDGRVAEKILDIIYASGKPDALVMHLNLSSFVGRAKPEVLDNLMDAALRVQQKYPGQAHFMLALRSDGGEIALFTRSIMEILVELAAGVEVPAPHLAEGRARDMPALVMESDPRLYPVARIRASNERPQDAFSAVQYRGYWFWIDDRDLASKRVFTFLRIFSAIAETGVTPQLPVLTIPAN